MKIVPWRLAVEDYRVCCVLLYVHNDIHRPLPRVYVYTQVGDFDTPTHQPTSTCVPHLCTYLLKCIIHTHNRVNKSVSRFPRKRGHYMYMKSSYMNNHVHSALQSTEQEETEQRKKHKSSSHTYTQQPHVHVYTVSSR